MRARGPVVADRGAVQGAVDRGSQAAAELLLLLEGTALLGEEVAVDRRVVDASLEQDLTESPARVA